jgi:hypothetical protein
MNFMKYISTLSIAAVLILTGCTKEPAAKTTAGHYLTATSSTIGTFSVTGTSVSAGGAAGAKISITAESASGSYLTLYINPYAGTVGVLPITGTPAVGGVYHPTPGTAITSVSGNITLTTVSPDIIGTFNYTASDGSTFAGSFDVAAP